MIVRPHPLKGPNRFKLGIFSANADGGLAITNAPHVFGTGDRTHSGPVTITYQTNDRSLAPPRSLASKIIQIAIVGALFFAAFLLLVSKL